MRQNAPGEYFHIYNRGTQKQPIFTLNADQYRFLFLLLASQGKHSILNINREVKKSVRQSMLRIGRELTEDIIRDRQVELVCFCLMPNHFHLIVREIEEGGISKYMQRIQNAYTKYFNTKYQKSGHLFQGPYKSRLVADDLYLMHLSAYIHKNPKEFSHKEGMEDTYYWSSFQDFVKNNRFPSLLVPDLLIKRTEGEGVSFSYKDFIRSSPAKELLEKEVESFIAKDLK